MPKQNPYLIENKKPVEEVREIPTYQPKYTDEEVAKLKEIFIAEQKEAIKKYQIKTSPLSPEARSKVIRKWGSDYVSEDREGYGPVFPGYWEAKEKAREEEERVRRGRKFCQAGCCEKLVEEEETYCYLHKKNPNYLSEEQKTAKWLRWGVRTVAGVGASAVLGPVGSLVAGGTLWGTGKIGENVSDNKGNKDFWNSIGSFGGDIAKGELAGKLWGIGGGEMAKEIGVSAEKGFKAGELSYSFYSPS